MMRRVGVVSTRCCKSMGLKEIRLTTQSNAGSTRREEKHWRDLRTYDTHDKIPHHQPSRDLAQVRGEISGFEIAENRDSLHSQQGTGSSCPKTPIPPSRVAAASSHWVRQERRSAGRDAAGVGNLDGAICRRKRHRGRHGVDLARCSHAFRMEMDNTQGTSGAQLQ